MDPNAALDVLLALAADAAAYRVLENPDLPPDAISVATRADLNEAIGSLVAYVGPEPAPPRTEAHEASPAS